MEIEEWKLIPNSKSYAISNFGGIKRLSRRRWMEMNKCWSIKPEKMLISSTKNSKGYVRIRICYKNYSQMESIHRLVAMMFKVNPNPTRFNQVNHIDGNKENNYWRNLQWCTNSMNQRHRFDILKHPAPNGEKASATKLKEIDVLQIPELLKTKKLQQIADMFGVGKTTISEIKAGRSWKHLNLNFN